MKAYSGGIRHDYKDTVHDTPLRRARRRRRYVAGLALTLCGAVVVVVMQPNPGEVGSAPGDPPRLGDPPDLPRARAAAGEPDAADAPAAQTRLGMVVARRDTLEQLFRRHNLSLSDLGAMAGLAEAARHLRLLRPGDEIHVSHHNGRVSALSREIDATRVLRIVKGAAGFEAEIVEREVEPRPVGAHGVIRHSLFEAAQAAGIPDAVTMNLAGIFQWDIDFIQDVRTGDEFTVIYEELWRTGVKRGEGRILAAEFINQGTPFRAVRYTASDGTSGYFTPEGRSVRKAFLRAPVDFTRISSHFNPNRRHPVLNTIRAHKGVDYAAPTGTVVKAAGDGRIIFRGAKNGYGNAVIVQHGGAVTTLYAHLSRFAQLRVGNRVRQGQTIGYVGMSGLATGPHLHYEYRIDGVHRNPRTVPLPPADPVPAAHREAFLTAAAPLWRELDRYRRERFASVRFAP